MMTSTSMPAPLVVKRNPDSRLQAFFRGSAPPPPSGGPDPSGPPGPAADDVTRVSPVPLPAAVSVGSSGKRMGSADAAGAASAEPANEGLLIRVSAPFVVGGAYGSVGTAGAGQPSAATLAATAE